MHAVPAPDSMKADALLDEIVRRGGRVHRMPEHAVFVLTTDPELAAWLIEKGAAPFTAPASAGEDSYLRSREGVREWDLYIHRIPVAGEETIHQAAVRYLRQPDA